MKFLPWIVFVCAAAAQTTTVPAQKGPVPPDDKAVAAPGTLKVAAPAGASAPADTTAPSRSRLGSEGAAPAKAADTFQSSMEKQRAAIAIQRAAVRKQSEMAVEWQSAAAGFDSPAADCDPMAARELTPLIDHAAQQHQVDSKLLHGVIEQESGFRPCAISVKGAKGLMQLMPATIEQFKVDDAFDPRQNIEAGATFLKQLLDKYKGDLKLALAAYNAGPGSVDKSGGIPDIKETQDYVDGIMKKLR